MDNSKKVKCATGKEWGYVDMLLALALVLYVFVIDTNAIAKFEVYFQWLLKTFFFINFNCFS